MSRLFLFFHLWRPSSERRPKCRFARALRPAHSGGHLGPLWEGALPAVACDQKDGEKAQEERGF